jgi:uncharacterized protein DUF4202
VSADRFNAAIRAIDAANGADPNELVVDGVARPKELAHAAMVTAWVERLRPDAGEALLLAARGHHFRRWTVPRASYPAGRAGYLRWRRDLHTRQADELSELLARCGYDDATIARVAALVRKDGLGRDGAAADAEVQTLEDAICLVFLETQLADFATRHDDDKLLGVLAKTAKKMSPDALARAAQLPLDDGARDLLHRALS